MSAYRRSHALAGLFALTAAFAAPHGQVWAKDGFHWWTSTPGRTVEFGFRDTDERILRIDCEHGRLTLSALTANRPEGSGAWVKLSGPGYRERLAGHVEHLGNGPNVVAPLPYDSRALASVVAGNELKITTLPGDWKVPGFRAAAEIQPLLRACRQQTR